MHEVVEKESQERNRCKRNAQTEHSGNHGQPEQPGYDDYGDVHKFSSRLSQHGFRGETDP